MPVDVTIKNPASDATDVDNVDAGESFSSDQGFLEILDSDETVVAVYTPGYWLSVIKRDEE